MCIKKFVSMVLTLVITLSMVFSINVFAGSDYDRVEIKSNGQCVDTLNGVKALYIKGVDNSDTGEYCCAAYVTKYFEQLYGIKVSNMFKGRTPKTNKSGYTFSEVDFSSAKKGDICYHQNSGGGGHWMIVKSASNGKITVIEQNWKWKSGSKTMAAKNRTFGKNDYNNVKIFRLNTPGSTVPSTETAPKAVKTYSDWKTPTKCYSTSTSNNITVYETSTSTAKYGTVYGSTDELIIRDWTDTRVKVTYPVGSGQKTGWIDRKYVSSVTPGKVDKSYTATQKITTYKRPGEASYGYIAKGDKVYNVATSGNWIQVIYPVSGGYKMAWIKK